MDELDLRRIHYVLVAAWSLAGNLARTQSTFDAIKRDRPDWIQAEHYVAVISCAIAVDVFGVHVFYLFRLYFGVVQVGDYKLAIQLHNKMKRVGHQVPAGSYTRPNIVA